MSRFRNILLWFALLLVLGSGLGVYHLLKPGSGDTIMPVSHKKNHLAGQKSPYLLQHVDNPVDWYPWGEEAFEKARREDKPIFLSIGYSTCHWCHVMEEESFEDPEVAALLNDAFVNIKVDREERPDIDEVYMTVCQMLTGSGGWPLTIIMTPDKKPFFAATYIPKHSRFGRPGLMELVPRIKQMWQTDREKLLQSAEEISHYLQKAVVVEEGGRLDEGVLKAAYQSLAQTYDARYGGFGQQPKFPSPHNLLFLLRYWHRSHEPRALEMVTHTLEQMRLGGVYDHIGFGFHRYATDARWLVPHFEKMLYDQAMLAQAYLEAYQATGRDLFGRTAQEIFTYVLRDMTDPRGGFYSAEDADSEGEEGKFYLWTVEEIRHLLPEKDARRVIRLFNLSPEGNFLQEAGGKKTGANILHLTASPATLAGQEGMSEAEFNQWWRRIREVLFQAREKRVHPLKDDKILTDWNGLMIAALARGARILNDSTYLAAARKAADFVLQQLQDKDHRLRHRFRDGEAAIPGYLNDYAYFIWGLIELYQTAFEPHYLAQAVALTEQTLAHFWDKEQGGFFQSPDDGEALLVRKKEVYDGAIPSGNSVMVNNLLRLSRLTGRSEWEEKAQQVVSSFAGTVKRTPAGYTYLLTALDFAFGPSHEVVIVGNPQSEDTRTLLAGLFKPYLPRKVVLFKPEPDRNEQLEALVPFLKGMTALQGKATAYVCQNFQCQLPTTRLADMYRQLGVKADQIHLE